MRGLPTTANRASDRRASTTVLGAEDQVEKILKQVCNPPKGYLGKPSGGSL